MRAKESRIARGLYWDSALNLVLGCMPFSEGCDHCWAAREAHMRAHHPHPEIRARYEGLTEEGRFNGIIRYNYKPLHAYQRARKSRVWSVWNDLFHVKVSAEFINTCFDIFQKSRYHTVIVLTKRIRRAYMLIRDGHVQPVPDNVILGTTVELPQYADRIETLLQIPARTRMVSLEPLLGPVDLHKWLYQQCKVYWGSGEDDWGYDIEPREDGISWVVAGCESGPKRRETKPQWLRYLKNECVIANVPFFLKQSNGYINGKSHVVKMPLLDGREWSEFP